MWNWLNKLMGDNMKLVNPLPEMKLPVQKLGGARPARHKLARAYPWKPSVITVPENYPVPIRNWSKWLNDQYGVCTTSEECANICVSWTDIIDDKTMYAWCKKHGFLNGADLPEVMEMMVKDPIAGIYSDGDYYSIDWTNESLLRAAIFENGCVKIAIAADQLRPTAAGESQGWVLTGARKDRSLDHCVSLVSFGTAKFILESIGVKVPSNLDPNKKGYCMFTWGTIGFIDQESLDAITGEAYVRKPSSLKNGKTPTPVNPPLPPNPPPVPPTPDPIPNPPQFDWAALFNFVIMLLNLLTKQDKK